MHMVIYIPVFLLAWLATASVVVRTEEPHSETSIAPGHVVPQPTHDEARQHTIQANRKYALQTKPARRIQATLTHQVHFPDFKAKEWTVYIAAPPVLPCQNNLTTRLGRRDHRIVDKSRLRRPLLMATQATDPNLANELIIVAEYQATLYSRWLVRRREQGDYPEPAPLSQWERKQATTTTSDLINFKTDLFQESIATLELQQRPQEGEIDYALRVFLVIRREFSYIYHSNMDRRASSVCLKKQSDCGGLAIMFVSVLRSQGVPARLLVGHWAKSVTAGKRIGDMPDHGQHVKAEFYAEGVGWIPVDPASSILHDTTVTGKRFFGRDHGDFITFHIDCDLVLDTKDFGEHNVPFLQTVAYWAFGDGSPQKQQQKTEWHVEELPMQE